MSERKEHDWYSFEKGTNKCIKCGKVVGDIYITQLEDKVNHWKHIAEINRLECETMHSEKEGLEKSIRHLQYTAIHRNDDNSVIVTSDLMNIKIKEGAET